MKQIFSILGGDMRQVHLAKLLREDGREAVSYTHLRAHETSV